MPSRIGNTPASATTASNAHATALAFLLRIVRSQTYFVYVQIADRHPISPPTPFGLMKTRAHVSDVNGRRLPNDRSGALTLPIRFLLAQILQL